MTATESMRLSAQPTEPMGTGGIAEAFDALGNPVCPDCGSGAITFAVLANNGQKRPCLCQPPDPRMKAPPRFRFEAVYFLTKVLDLLEAETRTHGYLCNCGACKAAEVIRLGDAE